jgi:glutamyl-tRNA reductase
MKLQMVGCSHRDTPLQFRERLAITPQQVPDALQQFKERFPGTEAVLISTCNRVEVYVAAGDESGCPTHREVVEFLAHFHGLETLELFEKLYERIGEDAVRHLFCVASGLDSMVLGEAQILGQVKQAYELARQHESAGTWMHLLFQRALRVANRVASETQIQQRRVSIPSVAVAEFAKEIFERFDDKLVVVAGAGEMAEETLTYLRQEGAQQIAVVNRTQLRAQELARHWQAAAYDWHHWPALLVDADLVITAVAAEQPILSVEELSDVLRKRQQRPLFLLDLGVPRNIAPQVARLPGVYLYAIDDLQAACEKNRLARQQELPRAMRIVEEETRRFMADMQHRTTAPTIRRLKERAEQIKQEELTRLWNKVGSLPPEAQQEIVQAFDRIVNKLLHPPLESLREHAERGKVHELLEALVHLFRLRD